MDDEQIEEMNRIVYPILKSNRLSDLRFNYDHKTRNFDYSFLGNNNDVFHVYITHFFIINFLLIEAERDYGKKVIRTEIERFIDRIRMPNHNPGDNQITIRTNRSRRNR